MLRIQILSLLGIGSLWASEVHLSPLGKIKTLEEARDAARLVTKPAKIIVSRGVYPISEALSLGPEDSLVTWESAPNAKVVISGGRPISGWKPIGEGLWQTELSEVRDGKWYFEQFWVNGRRAIRARAPNKGFLHMDAPATSGIFPDVGGDLEKWERKLRFLAFIASPETIRELNRAKPEELSDLTIIIPHSWDVHRYRVRKIDTVEGAVLMRGPEYLELLVKEPDGRFYAENYRAALDAPGEWFLGRDGVLLYYPRPGEDMSQAQVIAPVAEKLLNIDGATDVTFKGISFEHQQWKMGEDGFGDGQAVQSLGAAIEVNRSKGIVFDQCEIAHTGTYGIWFNLDVTDSGIRDSYIHDLGAGGVRIGPTSQLSLARERTGFVTVDNNIVQEGGRIFPDAVGVFIGHAGDNIITHNDIGDFYYSGISSGWHWGYGETVSQRNRFEYNHIHHLGWGVTNDMGGFYNLGTAMGTVVRGNHIHDISSYRYGGWGLYADEGTSGILMENNLVHDTSESGFHQHYGFYNTIRNNIFAFGKKAQIQRSRNEGRLSFVFERNIVVWNPEARLLEGTKAHWSYLEAHQPGEPKVNYVMRQNLYWPLGGRMPDLIADTWTWEEWQQQGRDEGSIITDPMFEDLEARDFRLKPGSPVEKIGFVPWDLTQAGVRPDGPRGAAWPLLAKKLTFPNWKEDSQPWPRRPFAVSMNTFEASAVGTLPLLTAAPSLENKGDSIAVSNEASSLIPIDGAIKEEARRSLKFQDAAGLSVPYHPLLALSPNWETGVFTVTFDVMGEPGADWFFEMRTDANGEYAAGPIVSWNGGKLRAGDSTILCDLPPKEWVRISITATIGSGRWKLSLTREDGVIEVFDGLSCKPAWNRCTCLLWVASADKHAAFFIDNLMLGL